MTNKNQTKRTLLMSIMALILCFTMLLGTTYAWFTDSVTSSGNKIVSGSLKVDLEVLDEDNTTWTSVKESNAAIFNYSNWEPGYTQVKVLRVANEGSLALKWYAKLVSTNGVSDLANVIDVYVKEDVTAYPTDRNDLTGWTCVGTLMSFINSIESTTTGTLEAYTSESLGIAFKMQESAGNEYQEMTLGEFDIIILATQLTSEDDAFGTGYDKDAFYADAYVTSSEELAAALANGGTVAIMNDIENVPVNTTAPYSNYYGIAQNGGVLDGNGNTLDFDLGEMKNGKYDNYGIMTSGGTIKNVEITGVFRGIMIMNPTEDVYIDNVVIGGDEDMCYAINTGEGDGTHSLVVSNSTIKGWSSYGTAIKDLTFTNCTFAQGEYYTDVFGRIVKPYVDTVFENCEFNSKFYIDLSAFEGEKIVLKNCTVNGVTLTAENWTSLIVSEDDCGEGQITIEGKNGSYMTASNIFDYVIFE